MRTLNLSTPSRNVLVNITSDISKIAADTSFPEGLLLIFCPHTTAGLTINEAADPDVAIDIEENLNQLIPHHQNYHHSEGNADSHIKSVLTGQSILVPYSQGKLILGTWQGIFFCEYDGPRSRKVYVFEIKTE
ncbi:MAG: secondary thiamine-phosphate synthase enzyme YjbQ [bacterium]